MQFTVTGVFKESEEASTPVVRHFSRTFLVVPQVKKIQNSDSLLKGSEKGSREPGALTLSWELCAYLAGYVLLYLALRKQHMR